MQVNHQEKISLRNFFTVLVFIDNKDLYKKQTFTSKFAQRHYLCASFSGKDGF